MPLITCTLNRAGMQIASILDTIPGTVKRRAPRFTAAELDLIKKEIVKEQNAAARIEIDFDEYEVPE